MVVRDGGTNETFQMPSTTIRSISDDDICATCARCAYKPGELSSCALNFPGSLSEGDYIDGCAHYEASAAGTADSIESMGGQPQ